VEAIGDTGLSGLRLESLRQPLTVITTLRDPAWSRCSQSQMPCQVPRFSFPSVMGIVSEEPRKQAFTWAGWNKETHNSRQFNNEYSMIYIVRTHTYTHKRV